METEVTHLKPEQTVQLYLTAEPSADRYLEMVMAGKGTAVAPALRPSKL